MISFAFSVALEQSKYSNRQQCRAC